MCRAVRLNDLPTISVLFVGENNTSATSTEASVLFSGLEENHITLFELGRRRLQPRQRLSQVVVKSTGKVVSHQVRMVIVATSVPTVTMVFTTILNPE